MESKSKGCGDKTCPRASCPYEGNEDLSWVERRGGCPVLARGEEIGPSNKQRVGQQRGSRGKKEDRWSYQRGRKSRRAGI